MWSIYLFLGGIMLLVSLGIVRLLIEDHQKKQEKKNKG